MNQIHEKMFSDENAYILSARGKGESNFFPAKKKKLAKPFHDQQSMASKMRENFFLLLCMRISSGFLWFLSRENIQLCSDIQVRLCEIWWPWSRLITSLVLMTRLLGSLPVFKAEITRARAKTNSVGLVKETPLSEPLANYLF